MQPKDNPKLIQAQKDGKAPLEYLIDSVMDGDAWVHKGGADKYGIRNWLIDKIKASTYKAAIRRHLKAWSEGEDEDPDSGWSHLYHIRASCAIMLDADKRGTLIDDRDFCESLSDKQEPYRGQLGWLAPIVVAADLDSKAEQEKVTDVYETPLGVQDERKTCRNWLMPNIEDDGTAAERRANLDSKADDSGLPSFGADDYHLPHTVRFFKPEAAGHVTVIYKGPFPDWWTAKEYAHKNPHNIAGTKTIHTLNRP